MFKERIDRVLAEMKGEGFSQILVTDPKSIRYLTGIYNEPYERMFVLYLRADGKHKFFLNRLFNIEQDDFEEVWFDDTDDSTAMLADAVDSDSVLGIDKTWQARFLIPLMEHCPDMPVRLSSDCVDRCRAKKDPEEQKLMKKASKINDDTIEKAMQYVADHSGQTITEREVAEYIDSQYKLAGCTGPSFTTIVSFGANAADPHHEPDDTVLREGDCVLIDMGCRKDGYCSDMTRTFFYRSADPEYTKIHDLVRTANETAEKMIRPGTRLCDVDRVARDLIAKAGYGKEFNHRLGHFIGQDDHEQGDVSATSRIIAEPGMIFSIEPGVYLKGRFGVRVEDLVLVTEDGAEILNHVDKHWKTVG